MLSRRAIRGWRQMLANQGLGPTLQTAKERLRSKIRPRPAASQPAEVWLDTAIHPFDQRFGTDTSGLIWGEDLPGGSRNDTWSTAYYGIAPSVFHTVLRMLPEDLASFTFVDFGSGKGRALMLASHYRFAAIMGVELSPELHAIAQANLLLYAPPDRRTRDATSTLGDATKFSYPLTPLVLYLNHPFCRPVLEEVLGHLQRSLEQHPRPLWLIYINPETRAVLDATPFLERVWSGVLGMDAEDKLADRVGSSQEEVAIYRSR